MKLIKRGNDFILEAQTSTEVERLESMVDGHVTTRPACTSEIGSDLPHNDDRVLDLAAVPELLGVQFKCDGFPFGASPADQCLYSKQSAVRV